MLNHIIRKTFEPGRVYKAFIRQSHQFKPKDKSQAFDAFLPNELQVIFNYEPQITPLTNLIE